MKRRKDLRDEIDDILRRFRKCAENHNCPGEDNCLYCLVDLYPDFRREILHLIEEP